MTRATYHPGGNQSITGICVELESILARRLSSDRFAHVQRVVHTAVALACRFGVPPERARLAALAHDWAREWSGKEIRNFLLGHGLSLNAEEADHPVLAHGKVAAILLGNRFGLADAEINEALEWHTIGRAGMGVLARILFVADYLEPGRRFTSLSFRRRTRRRCLACQVRLVIEHCVERHGELHPVTKELYDQVCAECDGAVCVDRGMA